MTTLFCVGWALQLGYFPRSLAQREISSSFHRHAAHGRAPASASAVDAQHWMIPRTVNISWPLHIWVPLHRNYRHRFPKTVGRGNDKPRIPRAVVLFVRMRSLSRPWASLLTEAFLITTVAVSAAMAGKTRFIRAIDVRRDARPVSWVNGHWVFI